MALQSWEQSKYETEEENQRLKNIISALMIGEKRPDSPPQRPGGPPWPGYPNPMPPGKDWPVKLAHGEHFDEYGRIIGDPTKGHADPSGNPITIPHLEQSPQEKIDNLKIHNKHYHQAMNYPPPSRLDKHLGPHQGPGGSLRHLPEIERLKILKQGLPLA